jgi:hypothetical protein
MTARTAKAAFLARRMRGSNTKRPHHCGGPGGDTSSSGFAPAHAGTWARKRLAALEAALFITAAKFSLSKRPQRVEQIKANAKRFGVKTSGR